MFNTLEVITDTVSFVAEAYAKHGSLNEAGGAHFFFGNHFDLGAGEYLVTLLVAKPKEVTSPRLVIEAMDWSSGEPAPLAAYEFPLANPCDVSVIAFMLRLEKPVRLELRGWSDVHGLDLDFRGLSVQRLAPALPAIAVQAPSAWFTEGQIFCVGYERETPLVVTLSGPTGAPAKICELITATAEPLFEIGGRPVWSGAIPKWLFAGAPAVLLSAGQDVYVLSMAAPLTAPEPVLLSSDAADIPLGVIGSVSRLARFREEAQRRLDKIEAELRGPISAMRSDLDAWRAQMPRLLNAISAANAAAATVGKSRPPDETGLARVNEAIDGIKSELALLWQAAGRK